MKKTIVKKKFERMTGPKCIFGGVCIEVTEQEDFSVKFDVVWPEGYDAERYNRSIKEGIVLGLTEAERPPTGLYKVIDVEFSNCDEANVPFAYKEAARLAAREIVQVTGIKGDGGII